MPEVLVSSLSIALQKQVESARAAFDKGKPEKAAELCAIILDEQPACLSVRKLERAALLKLAAARQSGISKMVMAMSHAPFLLGGSIRLKTEPQVTFASAAKLLQRDPRDISALNLMGQAALALGWLETAVFAFEAASDLDHERVDIWISLSGAYLASGRAKDAAHAAEEALRIQPGNADAVTLQRSAAVAVTMTQGKWDSSSDYRGKLADEAKAVQLEQAAKLNPKSAPPKQ